MGTVGKWTKFQLIRNTAAITSCDKLASIARIIKIISAVINRSIKLNLIINSTKFYSLVPIFIESQSQHTERMNEKKNNSLGWWRWLIPFWRRFNHPPLSVDSKVRNVLMIIFHLRSASLHQQSNRYQKVMAFLQTQKRHEDDC
jgi:hypothetical protein